MDGERDVESFGKFHGSAEVEGNVVPTAKRFERR